MQRTKQLPCAKQYDPIWIFATQSLGFGARATMANLMTNFEFRTFGRHGKHVTILKPIDIRTLLLVFLEKKSHQKLK